MGHEIANLLNVTRNGSGDQTLVLGHGFGTDQTASAAQVQALSQRYRLVLFDLSGCGGASKEAYNLHCHSTLHEYADDLLHLCGELGLEGATYIGHSIGGMLAIGAFGAASERHVIRMY
jgi:sigma-B regulation protein RsbQ